MFLGFLLKKLRLFKTDGVCMIYLWLKPQATLPYPSGIETINVRRMEITELNIMKNPACLAILSRHSFFA
jgi:hypothetical protein